jgi:hypothetical protein
MREVFAVAIVTPRLATRGISAAVHHVVPSLKPHEAGQLVARLTTAQALNQKLTQAILAQTA